MKLAESINSWRKRAGDDGVSGEFSDEYIRDLLNSALCEHVAIRLDLYGSYELMQLVTGDIQKIPPCWQYFGAVDAIVTKEGKKIADVKWNFKEYSFEFGTQGSVQVETRGHNGLRVPSVMTLNFKASGGRFETKFKTQDNIPGLDTLEVTTPQTGRFIFRFAFNNCSYR